MGSINKSSALILILVIAISSLGLIMVKQASAQSIPIPSVPEFRVQYNVNTYYIAPTYTTNPYTGQNETKSYGYQASNETVVFTIQNQPFTPYTDSSGNHIDLYYNFRYKGHFESQWRYDQFNPDGQTTGAYGGILTPSFTPYTQSSSDYTVISHGLWWYANTPPPGSGQTLPNGSQLDFQVQAQIGNIAKTNEGSPSLGVFYNFSGESSDWSNTQTLTFNYGSSSTSIPLSNPTLSPVPTSTPTVPEFPLLLVLPLFLMMLSVAVVLRHRKTTNCALL